MKFKVGDKVRGISDEYNTTNKDMYLGEIKEIGQYYITILILKHKNSRCIGEIYTAAHPKGRFEIVENLTISQLQSEIDELSNKVQKEYLKNVIKPFKNTINDIVKRNFNIEESYIVIHEKNGSSIYFPNFKKGTMYKGMKVDKEYTLKELGL